MNDEQFMPQATADGSFTFISSEFGESFHSHYGAKQEAKGKFVDPCQLAQKAKTNSSLRLLDICYGLGYNTAEALATIWSVNPKCTVEWIGLELESVVPRQAIFHGLLDGWASPIPQLLNLIADKHQVQTPICLGKLLIGDARRTIQLVYDSGFQADAIFLDPFSPPKCPQLWTVEFLSKLSKCLKSSGRLATYSCAASVRTALALAGLKIGSSTSVGRRSPGTIASLIGVELPPLSPMEQEHLQTRAAIPYRDRTSSDSAEIIWQRRQREQLKSILEPTSHWKKRWSRR